MRPLILCGAGSCGGYALTYLRSSGKAPSAFVDNSPSKWGTSVSGIPVMSLPEAHKMYPDGEYVVTIQRHDYASQIRLQLRSSGIDPVSLDVVLPTFREVPSRRVSSHLAWIVDDDETVRVLLDQYKFRETHDYELQLPPSPIEETYFPDFMAHIDDEVFVDVGAASGDTLASFMQWSGGKYRALFAVEPDPENFGKIPELPRLTTCQCALSDHDGHERFLATGSWDARLDEGGEEKVQCKRLDHLYFGIPPTYIKMDIEGSELEALWGARETIQKYSPVLAICAYHKPSHLWDIPFLIHALNPEYSLRLRRYAEGAAELVWYAFPNSRVKP